MSWLFSAVCFLSLAGSGAGIMVWVVCHAGKRLSCRWKYLIWLLPLLLFLLPVFSFHAPTVPTVPVTPPQATAEPQAIHPKKAQNPAPAGADTSAAGPAVPEKAATFPGLSNSASSSTSVKFPILSLLAWIWVAGVLILLVRHMVKAARLRRFLRQSTAAEGWETALLEGQCRRLGLRRAVALRRYAGKGTPFLSGLLRPTIYLPALPLPPQQLAPILTHELIHCRRGDLWIKQLAWLVRTVHWFNPLTWLLEREIEYRSELACDEAVAQGMNQDERRRYGLTLIQLTRESTPSAAACLAGRGIQNRLELLMKPITPKKGLRLLSVLLAAVLCLGSVALAAELHAQNSTGTYQTTICTDLYYVDWLCGGTSGDRLLGSNYGPGSGYNRLSTGQAVLVDTPLERSFSATVTADQLLSYDRNATAADALPASTFQVTMTKLDRVIDSRGEWVGRFTVHQDGTPIFINEPGKLVHVPSLDGSQLTELTVGPDGAHYFFARFNFGLTNTQAIDGAAAAQAECAALEAHPDTVSIRTRQRTAVVVDGQPTVPFFVNDFFVNDTLRTLSCDLLIEVDNATYSGRFVPAESAYVRLVLRPQDVKNYDGDKARGAFFLSLPNGQDREFSGTVSGLNGSAGDTITVRADDGSLSIDFTIERDRRYQPPKTEVKIPDGLDGESAAQYLFHETAVCKRDKIDGGDLPFTITSQGDTVTITYTGDPKYRAGARLTASRFGDWHGSRPSSDSQLLNSGPATFRLPADVSYLGLDIYLVSVDNAADFCRYDMNLYPYGETGVFVADCQSYELYNPNYTGAEAEKALTDGLLPAFMRLDTQ